MPFGSLNIEIGDKPKKEKKPRPDKSKVNVKKEKPKKHEPVKDEFPVKEKHFKFEDQKVDAYKINVLLIGRNQGEILDFLCSTEKNMSAALSEQGFSYYSRDNATVSQAIERMKKIEYYFATISNADWSFDNDEAEKIYVYSISPSGKQSKTIDIIFHCISASFGFARNVNSYDAVWLLTDGLIFEDAVSDGYIEKVKDYLSDIQGNEDGTESKPVCLVMTQIEKIVHYDVYGGKTLLPKAKSGELLSVCRQRLGNCVNENVRLAVFCTQVYGGMEYEVENTEAELVLRRSKSGFHREYYPCGCQLPMLYTLRNIQTLHRVSFFSEGSENLLSGIQNHYLSVFGKNYLQPMFIERNGEL